MSDEHFPDVDGTSKSLPRPTRIRQVRAFISAFYVSLAIVVGLLAAEAYVMSRLNDALSRLSAQQDQTLKLVTNAQSMALEVARLKLDNIETRAAEDLIDESLSKARYFATMFDNLFLDAAEDIFVHLENDPFDAKGRFRREATSLSKASHRVRNILSDMQSASGPNEVRQIAKALRHEKETILYSMRRLQDVIHQVLSLQSVQLETRLRAEQTLINRLAVVMAVVVVATVILSFLVILMSRRLIEEEAAIRQEAERKRLDAIMRQTEKMTSMTNLAAGMAHELNNPLGAIVQNTQNISRRLSPSLARNQEVAEQVGMDMEVLQAYLEKRDLEGMFQAITESCERASGIIKSLIDLSRPKTSAKTAVNIHDVIEQAISLACIDYELKHDCRFLEIEIVRQFDPDLPPLVCHERDMQDVILALLRNAAQAMADQPLAPRITVRTSHQKGTLRLEIEDNGPGLPPEIREHVFDPLFTTASPKRKGLGLSFVYTIVSVDHGGWVDVQSIPGEGAKFMIELPLASQD